MNIVSLMCEEFDTGLDTEWLDFLSPSESVESGDGNAINPPPPSKKPKDTQGKYWKANYHLKDNESYESVILDLEEILINKIECAEYFFGEEFGKSGKTRHIEGGFITRGDRKRWSAIMNEFKFSYLAKSNKKNLKANIKYAFKEGNRFIKSNGIERPEELILMTRTLLRPEQLEICNRFIEREDPLWGRKIYWFWEPIGNWGKSITATYMIDQMGAFEVSGKGADVLCGISSFIENHGRCPPIVIYDIPRSCSEYVSYQSIEKLKDGKFFSGKYESGMVRYNKPHIVCFANCPPDCEKMSSDRWVVECLISDEEMDENLMKNIIFTEDDTGDF